ncbi:MAG: ankyrin repeat domain-containing protein [Ottowia sp.]|nr:ankyrin repeat domain-containing protein [Ottowia sp.]
MNNPKDTSRCVRRAFPARTTLAASVFALACFAGLGNIFGVPAEAKNATNNQNSILATVQNKVAAGADAKALREELSTVISGGCEDGSVDCTCLSRAYAPATALDNRMEAARFLLDSGLDINPVSAGAGAYETRPLDKALQLLVAADALCSDYDEKRGIVKKDGIDAAQEGVSKIAALLVVRGAKTDGEIWLPDGPSNSYGFTSLGAAARSGSAELVGILIEKGANINKAGDYEGRAGNYNLGTPLHLAAEKGRAEIVKLLLEKGANAKSVNGRKESALKLAQEGLKYEKSEAKKEEYRQIISMLKAASAKRRK